MNIDLLIVYIVVTFFYVTSPGPAVLLAIINGLRGDFKIVLISSFANILGLFILSAASILGLGVIITTSALLFFIVKTLGAFYLIYLGYKFLSNKSSLIVDENDAKFKKSNKAYFYESFILAITNPKPILFFTAIFPQFLDLTLAIPAQFFVMTGIFLFISFTSLCTYAYLSKRSKVYLKNKRVTTFINKITGGIFVTMGIGLLQFESKN